MLNSYPLWAKAIVVVGILAVVATLALAPRKSTEVSAAATGPLPPAPKPTGNPHLCITGVNLFPDTPKASVRVTAIVNGTEFVYPSLEGVQWLQVGPSMSPQCFRLPDSINGYQMRFEMTLKDRQVTKQMKSTEVVQADKPPLNRKYALHVVSSMTRGADVSAEVLFTLEYR